MDQLQSNLIKNKFLRIILYVLFFLFATLYILSGQLSIQALRIFKVFPLLVLIFLALPSKLNKVSSMVMVGLIFGMGGDLVLQYYGQGNMFAVGAGLFLVGHAIYNFCMQQMWNYQQQINLLKYRAVLYFGFCFFSSLSCINLSTTISDKMKDQNMLLVILLPVYLIFLTVNLLLSFTLLVGSSFTDRCMIGLFIGNISFWISDNVLGRTVFTDFKIFGNRKINSLVIMVTYYLAQYLIVMTVNHTRVHKKRKCEKNQERQSLLTRNQESEQKSK